MKSLKFICTSIIFISNLSFAASIQFKTYAYEIEGKKVLMIKDELGHTFNKSCLNSDKCMAKLASKNQIALKDIPDKLLLGGKNPGSIACKEFLKGTVVIARRNNSEQSFCLFKDKSLVSTNNIWK